MEQTAVEYLVEQLLPKALTAEQYYHIEEAKKIDKQNIENAWTRGNCNTDVNGNPSEHYAISSEQYYQKTFKSE